MRTVEDQMMFFQLLAMEGPQTYEQIGDKLGFNTRKLYTHIPKIAAAGIVDISRAPTNGRRGRAVNVIRLSQRILEGAAQQLKEGAA